MNDTGKHQNSSEKNMDRQECVERLKAAVSPLMEWFEKEHRILPWRSDPTAYHVWLSEIMLQQTRVEAVKPYYHRFLADLPTIRALAEASEERLLKLWEGLGYYNRVRNLQKAAKQVVEQYDGELPADYEKVLALPGIGSYTAGAICSIAFQIPVPAVDGNVLRVLSRLLNMDWDIASASVKTTLETWLLEVIPSENPGDFNQALMELGAVVCTPNGIAKCGICPLADSCLANQMDTVMELPVKKQKKARRVEEKTVLLLYYGNRIAVRKRPPRGLLAGLYEFPSLDGYKTGEEMLQYLKEDGYTVIRYQELPQAKHIFSHVEWHMRGFAVRLDETHNQPDQSSVIFAEADQVEHRYAIPTAYAAYLSYFLEMNR